jgi:RHS repeat-associated protein
MPSAPCAPAAARPRTPSRTRASRTDASTGLEYPSASSGRALRARYYDTATGAFISRDPVANPNRYAYADGDPIMLTDPPGLCASDKSVAELRAKLDKLESRLGTGKLAEYWRAAWEESYASYAAHACGDGLFCPNPSNCTEGLGPATPTAPSAPSLAPARPHSKPAMAPVQPKKKHWWEKGLDAVKSGAKKVVKKITSPNCIGFAIDLVAVGVDLALAETPGASAFINTQLDAAGAGLDAGTGDIASVVVDVGTINAGAAALALRRSPVGTFIDAGAAVRSGGQCIGLW